jgi:penicillin-binding protein 1B
MRDVKARKKRIWPKALLAATLAGSGYGLYLAFVVTHEFDVRGWDIPARVYAEPLELYPGKRVSRERLIAELERLAYTRTVTPRNPGTYTSSADRVELVTRPVSSPLGPQPARALTIEFAKSSMTQITESGGSPVAFAELDPLLIGSIFPAHGEDRIVLRPDEVPPLLIEGLKAVEDRRFESHFGLDLRGIARAALANLRSGELEQGASTLTQQLVRSYFLTTERTWSRKVREAFMAVALELRKTKDEIAQAYINEIYLGQDGSRAIHGFGLASRFYFGKPLSELSLSEIALLIAEVRGPSYYDPRRNPERALARRDLVLREMAAADLISATELAAASSAPLSVVDAAQRSGYYPAFLDLVRRQLRDDYAQADLEAAGLQIFATLDPHAQALAEQTVAAELDALQPGRPPLEAAVIVTTAHNAEVKALVGGRDSRFAGFNRALDARRQVGSLIKPAVYLAAIESGSMTFADIVDDSPIDVELDDGRVWSPHNFEDETHGSVTLVHALAESMNLATVRVGMETGVAAVADTLQRLGLDAPPPAYPSLLLGALELTPLDVTTLYGTLANGGFRESPRAVRAVIDADGKPLSHYRIEMRQAVDSANVHALDLALVQVMQRGTGKTAQQRLPSELTTAGKTGTSDEFRDSWFAGFSSDHLVVAWVGNDANAPIGLTGATGAARLWSRIMIGLDTQPFAPPAPSGADPVWIDYETGLVTDARCANAVALAIPRQLQPPTATRCGSTRTRLGSKLRRWLNGIGK